MKRFFTYPVFVVLFLSFIGTMLFGSILRYHHLGGERFQSLQNIAVLISSIPGTLQEIFLKRSIKFQSLSPVGGRQSVLRSEQGGKRPCT